jgi:hypothetical protein
MQVLKGNEVQSEAKLAEKKEDEEVDLGYIDLFEPDPAHYRQAHANKDHVFSTKPNGIMQEIIGSKSRD